MITAAYNPLDLRYIFYTGDNIAKTKDDSVPSLEAYLNKIPSFMFMPSYAGIPKPEVFINKFRKGDKIIYYTYAGLWKNVQDWCKSNNVELQYASDMDKFKYTGMPLSLDEFKEQVAGWSLTITPRDYQVKAAWLILKYRRSMSQLATRAGKTLIAYMVFRHMLEHGAHNILMIVPNTTLVKQAVADMSEYKEFFKTETVWSEGKLCESSNLTVGTFQSLIKRLDRKSKNYNPKFFDKFDVICCDECHTAKCQSIKELLQQSFMRDAKLVFGFSGTVPDADTIESFTCQSLLGPKIQDIRSAELVNEGWLAHVRVTQVRVHQPMTPKLQEQYIRFGEYLNGNDVLDASRKPVLLPPEERDFNIRIMRKLPYAVEESKKKLEPDEYIKYLVDCCKAKGSNLLMLEQMLLHHSSRRIKVIDDILESKKGNTVVFAHHTEYIKTLHEHFMQRFPDRKVWVITGATSVKKRAAILKEMEETTGGILCASYACCGTGITFRNLDYGIFAQSFKAKTINLQSIGRGMLKTATKDTFFLYDIVDCFPTKVLEAHGRKKRKMYIEEKYDVITKDV